MVYKTVEQHLKKERALKARGIKVLSLFFIDKVANYRIYNDDGTTSLGKIGTWFEEAFNELSAKPMYRGVVPFEASQVHNGYFSQDKKGRAKDTRGNTADDEDTYALIMRDKERLLDPKEPLRFIFSHTAFARAGITRTSSRFAPCARSGPSWSAASRSAAAFACRSTTRASACMTSSSTG